MKTILTIFILCNINFIIAKIKNSKFSQENFLRWRDPSSNRIFDISSLRVAQE